ncbi:t-SNARE [Auriscalpium vulgare]|uniref:t-SNARE n=1 Tax=Auriscalpium vulgare TaxID=40419 RepID=A0ACB8S131_9AGAM|nr:t-SNARE [Auriscalpium vulgare]
MSSTPQPSTSALSPTTRSRTLLFISYRDSSARTARPPRSHTQYDDAFHASDEREGLIHPDTPHISLDVAELPPKWVDHAEQVEDILASVTAKIAALDRLHAKHVLPGFADRSAEEREIESATTDITKDFRLCQALIQRVGAAPHAFPPAAAPARDPHALAAKNVQRGLAAKVQELSATFRKKQRVYMEKLQGHAIKNQDLLVASGVTSLKGPEALSALDEDVEAASRSSQLASQQLLEPDLRSRDRELTEIAKSIGTLAELFKDLSALVIDQGTLLDSVEYNIEQTAANAQEAVQELDLATRYQKNTGRRKCIFLLILIIFGLVVVLIFKPRRHAAPATPTPTPTSTAPEIHLRWRARWTPP